MQHLTITLTIVVVVLASCQQPAEVELRPDNLDDELEIYSVAEQDTTVERPAIDSTAILPNDDNRFAGLIVANKITYDAGVNVDSAAFSRVFFADRTRPVEFQGRTVGYHGLDLDTVTLNGDPMTKILHRVRIRKAFRDTLVGFEYVRNLTTTFLPNTQYTWSASPQGIGPVNTSLRSPGNLTVLSPRGGSHLPKNQILNLQWTGQGDTLLIIISSYNRISQRAKPLLVIKPKVNRNHARLMPKFLRALPGGPYYVFTFVLANRNDILVNNYPDRVLVQSASIYNSYVEIR